MIVTASAAGTAAIQGYPGVAGARPGNREETARTPATPAQSKPRSTGPTDEDLKLIAELKARDREVRAHEAAHLAAAGGYAQGGANFSLERGPDGVMYATGGEVQIDVSTVSGDPRATIRKAETIRQAALAPASPSPQDRRVAAMASRMAMNAEAELIQADRQKALATRYGANASAAESRGGIIDQTA